MRMTLAIHIMAGSLALVAGYIALFAVKGLRVHRKAGMVFVYAMLIMCVAGGTIAVVRGVWVTVNLAAAVMTAYLVITALTTVRPPFAASSRVHVAGMLVALTVAAFELTFGLEAIAAGGKRNGIPAFPYFMFGIVGLLGGVGDYRVMRSGALTGASRIARHLWRMSFAMFIAAMSFFLGQAKVFPKPIRIYPLLAVPVLIVLIAMVYWLWRVRFRRSFSGIVGLTAQQAVR
jgi:hypothetical protein